MVTPQRLVVFLVSLALVLFDIGKEEFAVVHLYQLALEMPIDKDVLGQTIVILPMDHLVSVNRSDLYYRPVLRYFHR